MFDPSTVTVDQFKTRFYRDFPYLSAITYDPTVTYNTGDEVWYPTSNLFWSCLQDAQTNVTPGTNADVWVKCVDSLANYVQDQDITNAFAEAIMLFNQSLITGASSAQSDANQLLAFIYLSAHFLCNDLKAAMNGISGGAGLPTQGRSVGSVSESYMIPDAYKDNPIYASYLNSSYGLKYLQMILPSMTGNMAAVWGGSQA